MQSHKRRRHRTRQGGAGPTPLSGKVHDWAEYPLSPSWVASKRARNQIHPGHDISRRTITGTPIAVISKGQGRWVM
jgi:hypothetical protein